ncbi:MAG TPA: aspartyl protease family protein [Mucilaginibacter sp.]
MKFHYACRILTLAFIALFSTSASAQVAIIKLELYNHQVWLKAGLTGTKTDTLNFLFDSGAGTALLDSTVAYKIFKDGKFGQTTGTGAGGSMRMQVLDNQSIYLGGVKIDSVKLLVNNLGNLSATLGRKLDGIIGFDLLRKYVTRIDIDQEILTLYKDIRDLKAEKGQPLAFEYSPEINFLPRLKCSFTTLTGQNYSGWFFMDSGAGLTALLNTPFVNTNKLLSTTGKTLQLKTMGMTNASERYIARVKDFSFGGYVFNDVPLSLSQTTSGVNAMEGYLGLLGNEFLFRFNMTFDYNHDAIYLQPNKYYTAPFDFPLCGFSVRLENERVYVSSIAPDAPEKVQGLASGDEIVSVNNKANLSITEVRELLKHPGKIILKVKHANTEKTFDIPLYPRI